MTALEKYARLEALGLWRESAEAPPREVVVGFGDATLVLADLADRPLGHWALAGVEAVGRDGPATIYAMGADGGETLAIRDPDMVEAIAAVSRARRLRMAAAAAPARRWRALLAGVAGAAALTAVALAAPALLIGQAARMVPPEAAEELGDQMLLQVMAARGAPCADPAGRSALAAVAGRVSHGAQARLRVLDLGPTPALLLPGPTVALGRAALATAEDPAEIAGWIALALAREQMISGPERLMAAAGPLASLRYVFTGRLSEAALARGARAATAAPTQEEILAAYDRLRAAGLPTAPFADGLRRAGFDAPPATAEGATALGASDWAALHGLCD